MPKTRQNTCQIAHPLFAGSLIVWNASTGSIQCDLRGHRTRLRSVAFSPDSRHLLAGSQGEGPNDLILWDVGPGTERTARVFRVPESVFIDSDFGPDDATVLGASFLDGTILEWDRESGEILRHSDFPAHSK